MARIPFVPKIKLGSSRPATPVRPTPPPDPNNVNAQATPLRRDPQAAVYDTGMNVPTESRTATALPTASSIRNIVCDVCRSPYVAQIEQLWNDGIYPQDIAARYGFSQQLLRKHMTHREAAANLEATIGSVSDYIQINRIRMERLYAGLEGMFETIQHGLIQDFTQEGEAILNKTTITQIKPTVDSMLKLMGEARGYLEFFAKINSLYVDKDVQVGPTINIYVPTKVVSQPVTADTVVETKLTDMSKAVFQVDGASQLQAGNTAESLMEALNNVGKVKA